MKRGPSVVLISVSVAASAGLPTTATAQRPACPAPAPLAGRYGVSPRHLFRTGGSPGFSAELEPEVLRALRCEPAIKWVEHIAVGCAGIAYPAVEVLVVDAATDSADARGVTGVVRDGTYADTLRVGGGPAGGPPQRLVGAFERPGTYTVQLSKSGYHDWVQPSVRARPGVCSVERAFVRAVMLPRQAAPRERKGLEHRHP